MNLVRFVRLLGWLVLFGLGVLALGSCLHRERYLSRGISPQLPEPIAHSGLHLGVNVRLDLYLNDPALLNQQLSQIAATPSLRYLKQPFFFTEPFDWNAADLLINAVANYPELTLVAQLDGNPSNVFAPPHVDAFARFSTEFATRYGNQLDHYIIWDEPNLASHWGGQKVNSDQYAALLTNSYKAIHSADSTATVIAAPLAPTTESNNSLNLSEPLFLQGMYEAGAQFDVVGAKPYGFDDSPQDRRVEPHLLNFSRVILLREVMERYGDEGRAIWAGNWGWNSLPTDWAGEKSIWGEVSAEQQLSYTQQALTRAQREWAWMGVMFLENWQPAVPDSHPLWGFSIANSPIAQLKLPNNTAYTGFHLASPEGIGQQYQGDWRFSAEFGADSSEKYPERGEVRDSMSFSFWGTDVGLRVRRADFRARFYVLVDGKPANALPRDEYGTMLVLDTPNPSADDYLITIPIATGLDPARHTVQLVAHRGWNQWALNGFSVAYHPATHTSSYALFTLCWVVLAGFMAGRQLYNTDWLGWARSRWLREQSNFFHYRHTVQLLIVAGLASLLTLTGWLTWGQNVAGMYRKMPDIPQIAIISGLVGIYYVTPFFFIYVLALVLLLLIISFRPIWGVVLITVTIPFYFRPELLKPIAGYRFSPTEVFTLLTFGALCLAQAVRHSQQYRANGQAAPARHQWVSADFILFTLVIIATLSLFFTENRAVATNEWRTLIVESALFYALIRWLKPSRRETFHLLLPAYVLSGTVIALIGGWQLLNGWEAITSATIGLPRIQASYGSPNNVALYLGRIWPILAAFTLWNKRRTRLFYGLLWLFFTIIIIATMSKGSLFIGLPCATLVLLYFWLKERQYPAKMGLLLAIALFITAVTIAARLPILQNRLDLWGDTSFMRLSLWRSSLEMIREHPILGVGLDNFLYAYRGRYILEGAWREPYLNHPHNLLLDFATRLGLVGLLVGLGLFGVLLQQGITFARQRHALPPRWQGLGVGIVGSILYAIGHGMVDHSFFLIDLAFSTLLILAILVNFNTAKSKTHPPR